MVNEQVLPVEKLSIIGVAFILGRGAVRFWLDRHDQRWTVDQRNLKKSRDHFISLGTIAGWLAMALKYHWEGRAKDELDDFRHQIDIVRQQLKRAKHERDEIERQLPASRGRSMGVGTQGCGKPSDAAGGSGSAGRSCSVHARYAGRSSPSDFRTGTGSRKGVRAVACQFEDSGFAEQLLPHQLKEISQRADRISNFNDRLDQFKAEKVEREKELNALSHRIDLILEDTGVSFHSSDLVERMMQLNKVVNEQRGFVKARKEFVHRYKSLRSRLAKAKREMDGLLGKKRGMLAAVGAETEEIYREFDSKHGQRRKLISKRENLTEQILAALGKHFDEEQLAELLDAYGGAGLEKRWEEIQAEIERIKAQQSELHQQRGEFLQEVKMLGEDSRLDVARMEMNVVNAEIQQLQKDWQVLASQHPDAGTDS